jgi:hypothetical protein
MKLQLALVPLVLLAACSDHEPSTPKPDHSQWAIDPDSVNLALFIVDYDTRGFEGASFSHHPPSPDWLDGRMPLWGEWVLGDDTSHVVFHYAVSNATIFDGSVVRSGEGSVIYPWPLLAPDSFGTLPTAAQQPTAVPIVGPPNWSECAGPATRPEPAWAAVSHLDLVHALVSDSALVNFYLYPPHVDSVACDTLSAKWIVFLCRPSESGS